MNGSEDYQVTLTPRTFGNTYDDWHIWIITPEGRVIEDWTTYKWTAKLKARWIIRHHRNGCSGDRRQGESYYVKAKRQAGEKS